MPIVDIHCHNFNGDDLPVKGFVKRVGGTKIWIAKAVAWTVDKVVQDLAPGDEEIKRLDYLLEMDDDAAQAEAAGGPDLVAELDSEADDLLEQLQREERRTYEEANREVMTENIDDYGEAAAEGIGSDLKRYIKWAALFGKARLDLTRILIRTYPEVDLFCPLLVDLAEGLEDKAKTTIPEQLELQDKISRLSMRRRLDAQVHPFVGLDPRRYDAVPQTKAAVLEHGCVGVKLYPPMGFRPIENAADPPPEMSTTDAARVDEALESLYDFCVEHDVPITAHGNPTNFAQKEFRDFSSPSNWGKVLERWEGLRLNLGHFGGRGTGDYGHWPGEIAALGERYPNLYADNGNHQLSKLDDYFAMLEVLFATNAKMLPKFMYGTDWYMLASHRNFELFLERFRDEYRAHFPSTIDRFMGEAALDFLGFSDATDENNKRIRSRYQKYAPDQPLPAWIAAA